MKPTPDEQDDVLTADELNERVLSAAAKANGGVLAPEESMKTAKIAVWDESPELAGRRLVDESEEDDETISEQLVSAGNEEADREQRRAASGVKTP